MNRKESEDRAAGHPPSWDSALVQSGAWSSRGRCLGPKHPASLCGMGLQWEGPGHGTVAVSVPVTSEFHPSTTASSSCRVFSHQRHKETRRHTRASACELVT